MRDAVIAAFTPIDLPAELTPRWEKRYSGRLRCELDALQSAGITPEIDLDALRAGRLSLTFAWPLDPGTTLQLRAVFPDAYPHIRPQVFLLSGLDPAPARHRSPIEGNLCLLGRDSRQWMPSWTLHQLLAEQLEDAVRDTGDEDPQGEPADYWWNALNRTGSYCLIDSAWEFGSVQEGTLLLRYAPGSPVTEKSGTRSMQVPIIRAYVEEVRSSDGAVLHRWNGAVPAPLAKSGLTLDIPWVKANQTVLPDPDLGKQMRAIRDAHPWLQRSKPHRYQEGLQFDLFAIVHPSETGFEQKGLGWIFFFPFGHLQAFKPANKKKGNKTVTATVLPVYRAGADDIGHRVPALATLKQKRVLVVGTGAVGAPVVIELARNGCGTLQLIEHDTVEPGNTVRWPLGASAWGHGKLNALETFLAREYPATTVRIHTHFIGHAAPSIDDTGDDEVLDTIIPNVDLVIDASASHGVTTLLADRCKAAKVPLISLFATPTLEGGAIVRHVGDGGCPNCLEYAWHNNEIIPPLGRGSEDGLTQPPGCAERTFIGAGYDLQELSLQAVRLAVETLSAEDAPQSVVQTLGLIDEAGHRRPPHWRVDPLPKHPACRCGP